MDSSSVSGLDNGGYWPMTEILEESSQKYKVSWKGTNPGTGKPWPPSWVPKSDCRDQLVTRWQKKVKLQEEHTYRPSSASGLDTTTVLRVSRENRKPEPGKSEDSGDSAESDSNANFSPAIRSTKVGPPRGVPKGHSSSANSSSGNPNRVKKSRQRLFGDPELEGGCINDVEIKTRLAKDVSTKAEPSSFHSIKVGPPGGVAKKPSGTVLGSDKEIIPNCRPSLNLKRKRHSKELTDDCDELYDPKEVRAMPGEKTKQNLPARPNELFQGVRKVQSGSALVNDPNIPANPAPLAAFGSIHHEQPESCASYSEESELPLNPALALRNVHQEQLVLQCDQSPCVAAETKSASAVIVAVDQFQSMKHSARAPNPISTPGLVQLLGKVEEIKRLQCTISMSSNAAMGLCMEVTEALNILQKDMQQHDC